MESTLPASYDNRSESFDDSQEQMFVRQKTVKNSRLNLGDMRGMVVVFNHLFAKKPGKRMSVDEKQRRWSSYKQKIYQQYGRIITSKFASEKALIKRYSEPMAFLRYRLKRYHDLRVSDLSTRDQDYYHEIGGCDDLEQMAMRAKNIGSVRHMSNILKSGPAPKRRRTLDNQPDHTDDRNHNRATRPIPLDLSVDQVDTQELTQIDLVTLPPKLERKSDPKTTMAQLLDGLQDKLDLFERDQLEKRKIETSEITAVKMKAMAQAVEEQFMTKPHLIGAIPSINDQPEIAFQCWLARNHEDIFKVEHTKVDVELFTTQLVSLKAAVKEWQDFLTRWKLLRILYKDDFSAVWKAVRKDLNIPGEPVDELVEFSDDEDIAAPALSAANDKDEL